MRPAATNGRSARAIDPFVGREAELDALRETLDEIRGGRLAVAVVEGEAGIGKSRLIAEAVQRLPKGWTVVAGAGDEIERTRPFGTLAAALGVVPSSADPGRAAVARLLLGGTGEGAGERRYLLVEELLSLVERAAIDRPLVVVLDDLQWVDDGTLLVVRELARRLADLPIAILVGLRSGSGGPAPAATLTALEAARGARIALAPLGPDAATELAGAVARGAPGPRLTEQLAAAGGNPLYLTEMVRALDEQGDLVRDGTVVDVDLVVLPPPLRLIVLRRLSQLSERTLELLRVAAVLGLRFDVVDLTVACGRSAAELGGALGEAVDAGVLEPAEGRGLAFRHVLVHDAIYEDLAEPLRAALHLQIARALAGAGSPALTVAHHVAVGAAPGDRDAVRWLFEAAGHADPGSPQIALELARRALAIADATDPLWGPLTVLVTGALVWAGELDQAWATVEEALAHGRLTEAQEADVRAQLAWAAVLAGRPADAQRITAEALERPAPGEARRFQLQQLAYGAMLGGDLAAAHELARQVIEQGEAAGDDRAVSGGLRISASILLLRGEVREAMSQATEAIERARAAGGPALRWAVGATLVQALFEAGRFPEATRALAEAREEARRYSVTWVLPMYHWWAALLCYLTGRPDDAVAEAQAGFDLARETGVRHGAAAGHAVLALVAVDRNDVAGGREEVAAADAALASGGLPMGIDWLLWARARVDAASGDAAAGLETLAATWEWMAAAGMALAPLPATELVALAVAGGRDELAADVAASLAARADESALVAALAAQSQGVVGDDPVALEAAAGRFGELGAPGLRARAHEAAANALAHADRRDEAVALLQTALAADEASGATRDAARVGAALRAHGIRRGARGARVARDETGWESLTRTQRSIAELVSQGLTNAEIASRLFVSPRTVETHVSDVLRKLGVRSRKDVIALGARRAALGEGAGRPHRGSTSAPPSAVSRTGW